MQQIASAVCVCARARTCGLERERREVECSLHNQTEPVMSLFKAKGFLLYSYIYRICIFQPP